jgi:hypothetical protein
LGGGYTSSRIGSAASGIATMPLNKKNLKLLELRHHKLSRHLMGLPLREVAHHQELELEVLITKL